MLVVICGIIALSAMIHLTLGRGSFSGSSIGGAIGSITGGPIGGAVGSIVGGSLDEYGWLGFSNQNSDDDAPNVGSSPTEADIAKKEADKSALRRQRAAALLAQGTRANILTSPLGIPGGSESNQGQGRKTLLGS